MAKKRSRKSANTAPFIRLSLGRRLDIAGIVLMALALLTLLGLISVNRGALVEEWIHILRLGFGLGAYLLPLGLAIFGLWLVLLDLEGDSSFDWERPAGLILLFIVLVTGSHLVAAITADSKEVAALGGGGGYTGWAMSLLLSRGLGIAGAWVVLLAMFFVSLIFLLDITLAEFVQRLVARCRSAFSRRQPGPRTQDEAWVPPADAASEPPAAEPVKAPEPETIPIINARSRAGNGRERGSGGKAADARDTGTASPVPGRFNGKPSPETSSGVPPIAGDGRAWELPSVAEIFEDVVDVELSQTEVRERVRVIEETLASFGVPARVVEVNQGPAVTQFGVAPGFVEKKDAKGRIKRSKVKVSRISGLSKDLALALAASPIRIEAPVPGRPIVGIEVPNTRTSLVSLRSVMESDAFQSIQSPLRIALGQDVSGQPICANLASMPHLLIAGATGSGKSVCINAIVACLLAQNTPQTLRLLMIDPKRVELVTYNGAPHLISPVIVDLEEVVGALQWATREMDRRYQLFAKAGVRNLEGYNAHQAEQGEPPLPLMVIVIDELADLMMLAPDEVERAICRLAQMARATGIHLIIATQRPSVDVVTGLIKANFPARISFAVTSQVDSRVILDVAGAEQLLGHGDMLYMAADSSKLKRLQGCFVSDRELHKLVRYWKGVREAQDEPPAEVVQPPLWSDLVARKDDAKQRDDLFDEALRVVTEHDRASISMLQRRLRIGYSRAARLIDALEEEGYVGPEEGGSRSRMVLMKDTPEDELSSDES